MRSCACRPYQRVRAITIAFVRLPELIQGIIITLGSALYLAWLSPKTLAITTLWLVITLVGGWLLVSRIYQHMAKLRGIEDDLYRDIQTLIEGRKELQLNREQLIYDSVYQKNATSYRRHVVCTDTFHLSAVNWSNIMMLGAIGIVFYNGERVRLGQQEVQILKM